MSARTTSTRSFAALRIEGRFRIFTLRLPRVRREEQFREKPEGRPLKLSVIELLSISTCGAASTDTAQVVAAILQRIRHREQHKGRMSSVGYHFFNQYAKAQREALEERGYGDGEKRRDFLSVEMS